MIRVIFSILLLGLIQGCSTFHIGEFRTYHDQTLSAEKPTQRTDLPVLVNYFTTYGDELDLDTTSAKKVILDTTKDYFSRVKVGFREDYKHLPDEYINIYVLQDFAHDAREGDFQGARGPLALISGFTFMIIPFIDSDIEHIIKISHIQKGVKKSEHSYLQDSRRVGGVFFLPASPFFKVNDSLNRTLISSLKDYLNNES
jgi:hypothetical protein